MIYRLRFTSDALEDIERHKKAGDKKLLKKIEALLEFIQPNFVRACA